jgi:hypothetical protein
MKFSRAALAAISIVDQDRRAEQARRDHLRARRAAAFERLRIDLAEIDTWQRQDGEGRWLLSAADEAALEKALDRADRDGLSPQVYGIDADGITIFLSGSAVRFQTKTSADRRLAIARARAELEEARARRASLEVSIRSDAWARAHAATEDARELVLLGAAPRSPTYRPEDFVGACRAEMAGTIAQADLRIADAVRALARMGEVE